MNLLKQAQQQSGMGLGGRSRTTALTSTNTEEKPQEEGVEVTLQYNEPHHERIIMIEGEEPRPVCIRKGTKTFYALEDLERYKDTEFAYGMRQHEYAGRCRANTQIREGYGAFYYASGENFYGMWRNNMRHGLGEVNTVAGYRYEGDWRDDKITGRGREVFPKGEVYDGEFLNGRPHGTGVLWYVANGSRFEGTFENGRKHGPGVMWYANGDVFQGTWINGKREGRGLTTYGATGKTFASEWKNDQLTGNMKSVDSKKVKIPAPLAGPEPSSDCPYYPRSLTTWHVPNDATDLPDYHFAKIKNAFDAADTYSQGELSLRQLQDLWQTVADKSLLQKIESKIGGNPNAMIDLLELLTCWYPNVPPSDLKRFLTVDLSPEILLKLRGSLAEAQAAASAQTKGFYQMCDQVGELSIDTLRRHRFMIGGQRFSERAFNRSNYITDKTTVSFLDCLEIWYPNIEWQRLVRYEADQIPPREFTELSTIFDQLDVDRYGYLSLERFKQVQSSWLAARAQGREFVGDKSNAVESTVSQGFLKAEATWSLGALKLSVRLLKAIDRNKTGWISLLEIMRYCYPNVPCLATKERLGAPVNPSDTCRCALCTFCGSKYTKPRPASPYNEYVQW